MERVLTIEMVRVTEAAALAAAEWIGRYQKNLADDAATQAMRQIFNSIHIRGTVVIGEGELDEAPMLYIGEQVGNGEGPEVDVAVDPLEGTSLVATGANNSISVLAIADRGNLLHAPDMYMQKIAVGPKAAGKIDIDAPVRHNLKMVAEATGKALSDLTVIIQDRPRHKAIIQEVLDAGARIKLFGDGDVGAAIATAIPDSGVDMFIGTGGAPEGVVTAVALKCLGGELQGRLKPQNDDERRRCMMMGLEDPEQILLMHDLVKGDDAIFAATGISTGDMLRGVRYLEGRRAETHSVVMRYKTRTVRWITAEHQLDQKEYLVD